VNVKDDYFVRTPDARGTIHLVILLGEGASSWSWRLRRFKGRLTWGTRGGRGIEMAEAMQREGYRVD